MRIAACPKCGSTNIRVGSLGDGVLAGYTTQDVCNNCGYRGQPLYFESEKEYKKFVQGLKKPSAVSSKKTGKDTLSDLSDKDKEIIDYLKECEKQPTKSAMRTWPEHKRWWPEIILAVVITAVAFFSGFVNFTTLFGWSGAALYVIIAFIAQFVVVLFAIVFIEYIIRSMSTYVKHT